MEAAATYTAFAGTRQLAMGSLRHVLPVLKQRFDQDRSQLVLVFEVETGRQVDFDLRGSLEEVLEREAPLPSRGPGRPKLGVTSREVSLFPRHWEWLEQQSSGISGALRRLVEHAFKSQPGKERARRIRAALSRFLSSMAGDRPHYEEATRALFNGDVATFERLVRRWPKDIQDYALQKAREAAQADEGGGEIASVILDLHRLVWNRGEYGEIERLVAPHTRSTPTPAIPGKGRSSTAGHTRNASAIRDTPSPIWRLPFTRLSWPAIALLSDGAPRGRMPAICAGYLQPGNTCDSPGRRSTR